MNKKNYFLIVTLAVIALISVIVILQFHGSTETPPIAIPSPSSSTQENSSGNSGDQLKVSADSVQELLESISRPDTYSRKYAVTLFFDGGEARADISAYRKNDMFRIIHADGIRVKNTLIANGTVSYWYDGSAAVFTAELEAADTNALDSYARLVFYDELLDMPKEDILDAAYEVVGGESCIYVEYRHSDLYTYRLYVSEEKGLLIAAEVLENGKTIYTLESEFSEITTPSDDMFILPR
jgi:hypothetical protein